jgi:hypothetical protein
MIPALTPNLLSSVRTGVPTFVIRAFRMRVFAATSCTRTAVTRA